ncbi:hypothetical protein FGD71_038070 [Streptomyces sporangiiformans]|uniref:Uncharacterized protein n=1 Tax=Streptomyces sporangiiformans TaxID=2315329 RepID=A0A505D064_9ACTN|nr:hypothetical protein FGD71_038070 [Streptomyces sporangiiformans]
MNSPLFIRHAPGLRLRRRRAAGCEAGDNWTWLVITAPTQLRLVRQVAADLGRPWARSWNGHGDRSTNGGYGVGEAPE